MTILIEHVMALRWRDLDAYHHVNNSVFLTFLEEARIQWFESLSEPWRNELGEPVVAASQINFRRPILYPETLAITLSAGRLGRSSFTIAHRIVRQGDPSVLYSDGETVLVWVSPTDGRPVPLPPSVRAAAEGGA